MNSDRKTPVTREGLERLKEELRELTEVKRPEIVAAIADARSHGDLRENAAYDAARPGFFMTPADPKSNNDRIYVVARAVRAVAFIQ